MIGLLREKKAWAILQGKDLNLMETEKSRKENFTDEVYFNDNLTELHFPDGLISFA